MDNQLPVILTRQQAQLMQRDYVCAGCWGHLEVYAAEGANMARVACPRCGDGRGFVTKSWTEQRRVENMAEAREVNQLLAGLGIIEKPARKTKEQILHELGF